VLWQDALALALAHLAFLLFPIRLVDDAAFRRRAFLLHSPTARVWALIWLFAAIPSSVTGGGFGLTFHWCGVVLGAITLLRLARRRGSSTPAPATDRRLA
jgi:hypothetical protein